MFFFTWSISARMTAKATGMIPAIALKRIPTTMKGISLAFSFIMRPMDGTVMGSSSMICSASSFFSYERRKQGSILFTARFLFVGFPAIVFKCLGLKGLRKFSSYLFYFSMVLLYLIFLLYILAQITSSQLP